MLRKILWPAVAVLACLPLVGATYAARSILVHAADSMPAGAEEEETELEKHMLTIQDDIKALRRAVRDPQKRDEALRLVDSLQAASLACKSLVPMKAEGLGELERSAFITNYRREMLSFMRGLFSLEDAILDGDMDIAGETLKRLRAVEDPSHEKFMKDF